MASRVGFVFGMVNGVMGAGQGWVVQAVWVAITMAISEMIVAWGVRRGNR